MTNTNRAAKLLALIDNSATPARTAQRAARLVFRMASANSMFERRCRTLFWVGSALRAHGHALAHEGISKQEVAYQTERRDRCLVLAERAASPSAA